MGVKADQLDDSIGRYQSIGRCDRRNATPTCFLPRGCRLSLASRPSHYEGSQQEIRPEIKGFWVTTFDGLRGTPMVVGENDTALPLNSSGKSATRQANMVQGSAG
jgi:hypothetical protein